MRLITLFFIASAIAFSSCEANRVLKQMYEEKVTPTTFKTQIPFELVDNQRIILSVPFTKENLVRRLSLDNHAPTSIPTSAIANNASFIKVGTLLKGKTVDGQKIDNIKYLTDGVKLGNTTINHVMLTGVIDRTNRSMFSDDGTLGDNVMILGAWKIDFEHKTITFANSIDSLDNVKEAQKLAAKFTRADNFIVDVTFNNNLKVPVEIDLGANGTIVLKKEAFDKMDVSHKAVVSESEIISMAGAQTLKKYTLNDVPLKIGGQDYKMAVRSFDKLTTSLLGMSFFSQFKFIIFDYPNKTFYLSNEKISK
jgi:predicted aspartyl protease